MGALKELKDALKATGMDDDQIQSMLDNASKERQEKRKAAREAAKKAQEEERKALEAAQAKLDDAMGKISDVVRRCGLPAGYQITIQVPKTGDVVLKPPRKIPVRTNGSSPSNLTVERFEEIRKALTKSKPSKPSSGKIVVGKLEISEREACQAGLILASLAGDENPSRKAVEGYFKGIRSSVSGSWIQKYKAGNGDSPLSHFLSEYQEKVK